MVLGLILLPVIQHPPFLLFALLWIFNGVGQALIALSSSTLLAEHVTEAERGRGYAAHFALTHAFWLFSYPAIGHGISEMGVLMTLSMAGVLCLLIAVIAILSRKPTRNHMHLL